MEWLNTILGGGLFGVVGGLFQSWFKLKAQREQFRHDEKMAEIDIQMQAAEMESMERREAIKWEGEANVADAQSVAASYGADKATYSEEGTFLGKWLFPVVDFLRGMTRPGITWYLVIAVTCFGVMLHKEINGFMSMSGAEVLALYKDVIQLLLFLAATSVSWWFGSRNKWGVGK